MGVKTLVQCQLRPGLLLDAMLLGEWGHVGGAAIAVALVG